MYRIEVLCMLFTLLLFNVNGQTKSQGFNLIIVINDEIATSNITGLELVTEDILGKKYKMPANYYPGELNIESKYIDKILSDDIKSILLKFTEYRYINKRQIINTYEIELKKAWIEDYYFIIRIYDLSEKRYRKRFKSFKDRNYVYELDSPCCTFRLVE